MLTRCPECGTWFEVTEAHLALAGGRVHCGRCDARFDARAHLAEGIQESGAPEENRQESHPPEPDALEERAPDAGPEPAQKLPVPMQEPPAAIPRFPSAARAWHGPAWVAGCVLLTLTIGLQTLWWWRNDWAATPTGLRLVQGLCRVAPCRPLPPRAPERIEVLDRSLQPDPQRKGVLQFHLQLVSRAEHPQPYPWLELRLYDHLERLTAARRFEPDDYLPPATARGGLLEPNRPLALGLELVDPGSHVTGFQIDFL